MVEEFEKAINGILLQNANVKTKKESIKNLIETISSKRAKNAFLHAYNNYQWPNDDKDVCPEFKLTDIERRRSDDKLDIPGWSENIFDAKVLSTSYELIDNADFILKKDILAAASGEIRRDLEKTCHIKNWCIDGTRFNLSRFDYVINHIPGDQIDITITEDRTDKGNFNKTTRVRKYNIRKVNGKVVIENMVLNGEKLNTIYGLYYYANQEKVFEEWCKDEPNVEKYSKEEIDFVKKLGLLNMNSRVVKRSIENSLDYTFDRYDNYYSFCFGKKDNDFSFCYRTIFNDYNIYVSGDLENALVLVYKLAQDDLEKVEYEDLARDMSNSEEFKKVEEILNRLEKLGVTITYKAARKK